jgi:hypothetical protein
LLPDSEWREPVDALIEIARAKLPLIQETWPQGFGPVTHDTLAATAPTTRHAARDARRRLLSGPKSLEPLYQKWAEIGRHLDPTGPDLNPDEPAVVFCRRCGAAGHRLRKFVDPEGLCAMCTAREMPPAADALADSPCSSLPELQRLIDEAELEPRLQLLERNFATAMLQELRRRWEGDDLAGPIANRVWSLPQLRVDWGGATTQIGDEPRRYGLRLRRIEEAPPDQPSEALELRKMPLSDKGDEQINDTITTVYEDRAQGETAKS